VSSFVLGLGGYPFVVLEHDLLGRGFFLYESLGESLSDDLNELFEDISLSAGPDL
jgi:hypothetical protein